jgi:hypothetical protein
VAQDVVPEESGTFVWKPYFLMRLGGPNDIKGSRLARLKAAPDGDAPKSSSDQLQH